MAEQEYRRMIRPATHSDIPVIVPMLISFFDCVDLAAVGLVPDPDTVEFLVQDVIDDDNSLLLVAECDGQIIGGIMGAVKPWMFNYEIATLVEMGWFIPKEHRNKYPMAAMSLRKQFHKWGKGKGATTLIMSSTKREESPRVMEMYEKSGLKHLDSNFFGRL